MEEKLRLFIADHPFFKDISQSERLISDVVRNAKIKKIDQYRIIVNQDEPLYYLYFILSGQISIFVKKQKMELDYERELRLHFEEVKKKFEFISQNESENKAILKKAEIKLKNAFKQVDRNEKQYDDPIYKQTFPNFEAGYMTNKFNIFPLKRVLTLNVGQVIGESGVNSNNNRLIERISNITAVSQSKVTVAQIPIEYLNSIIPLKKQNTITTAFESYFGSITTKDLPLISQFFEKQIFEKNKSIFKSKENTDKIYVIGGGEVELSTNIQNQTHRLMLLLENDIFGHENFSYERSYKATSISNETFVYTIEKQLFFELIENKIIFSQITSIGDEKLKRSLQILQQNIQTKLDQAKKQQEEELERMKQANSNSNAKNLKTTIQTFQEGKKAIQLHSNKVQFQEGQISNDHNSSLIIQGTVNASTVYEKKRSYTNHGSDKKDSLRSASNTLPERTPLKNKSFLNDQKIDINSLSIEQHTQTKGEQEERLESIVVSGEKHKKYRFGFGSSKKKENLTLPSISSQEQNTEEKQKRTKSPPIILNDNQLFQNEKLKETQIQLEETLLLNQKSNLTKTSFESKDTQILFQKNLAIHQTISNELTKHSIHQPKNNIVFLQDLSQQENFLEIQDKVKQQIFRKKQKSPSPSKGRKNDGIDYIIQSRLRKIKSRHHSIENINSSSIILLKKKNHQTTIPLDVQFQMERTKYKKEQKKEDEDNSHYLKTEISLNITDQMRAITPLQSMLESEQDKFSSDFTLKNDVLRNISQQNKNNNSSSHKELEKSIIMQKYLSVTLPPENITNSQGDFKKGDQQLMPYNLVKLSKKRKQLKILSDKKQDSNLIRQSSELKYIDYEGISLSSKMNQTQQIEQKLNTQTKQITENDSITINPLPQSNRNISIPIQQSQQLVINGEQKLIRDKMITQPVNVSTTPVKKQLQTIQLNNSTTATKQEKKNSKMLAQLPKTTHNTLDALIIFEQNSTSEILNHQVTMPLMQKTINPSNVLIKQQKIRSMTIEEPVKSHNKLNATEMLDNYPLSNKKINSVSPMYRIHKDNLNNDSCMIEASSNSNLDHPVIHQNKKKFSKLPEILKHKAYIQKKLKRQFIRSPQMPQKFEVFHFNQHLQMYQDTYNQEQKSKIIINQENKAQQNTSEINLSMTQYVDSQIFSLSQPEQVDNKQNNKTMPIIKVNSEQIDLLANSQKPERNRSNNSSDQFKKYEQQTQQKVKKQQKSQHQHPFNSSHEDINSLYNTLYVKKIMKESPPKNSHEEINSKKQKSENKDTIIEQVIKNEADQEKENKSMDLLVRGESKSSNYSVTKSNNQLNEKEDKEKENSDAKSPNQMKKTNSQCSFAFGSPIKYNMSYLAQEQNKLLSLNRDPKSLINSFYLQSNSPAPNQQATLDKKSSIQTNNIEVNRIKKESSNLQIAQRQPSIKNISNQQPLNLQSVSLANNDLSHLSIIKQLEIQRQTDALFSYQSHNSPKND